jgi:hypothetical protein
VGFPGCFSWKKVAGASWSYKFGSWRGLERDNPVEKEAISDEEEGKPSHLKPAKR